MLAAVGRNWLNKRNIYSIATATISCGPHPEEHRGAMRLEGWPQARDGACGHPARRAHGNRLLPISTLEIAEVGQAHFGGLLG